MNKKKFDISWVCLNLPNCYVVENVLLGGEGRSLLLLRNNTIVVYMGSSIKKHLDDWVRVQNVV